MLVHVAFFPPRKGRRDLDNCLASIKSGLDGVADVLCVDDGLQRIPKLTSVPFRMAKDCQYTLTELGKVDARCDGCKHRKDAHE